VHFFCQYPFAKKILSQNVTREKLREALLYKKRAHKKLMTLTPLVNFTNILQAGFLPIFFQQKLESQTLSKDKLRNFCCCNKQLVIKCW